MVTRYRSGLEHRIGRERRVNPNHQRREHGDVAIVRGPIEERLEFFCSTRGFIVAEGAC